MKIRFTKMHGAGNDYIYVNTSKYPIDQPEKLAKNWSKYHFGIGSDGLVLIGRSKVSDFSMRIFNNDGSEAMMCGNASRCVAKYVYEKGLTNKKTISLETLSGIKILQIHSTENDKVKDVTVDMGCPLLSDEEQFKGSKLEKFVTAKVENQKEYIGTFVSMGNPHFVIFTQNLNSIDVEKEGKVLEFHSLFPQRCNIEFAEIQKDGSIRMRVWERGSGITMACGTGACATAVAAIATGKVQNGAKIMMDGGFLDIQWNGKDEDHVFMTGPAAFVFEGEIEG